MKNKNKKRISPMDVIPGDPETAEEMVSKYGTYNIQPTADSDHHYPKIGQGYPKDPQKK